MVVLDAVWRPHLDFCLGSFVMSVPDTLDNECLLDIGSGRSIFSWTRIAGLDITGRRHIPEMLVITACWI